MSSGERWMLDIATAAVAGTGAVLAIMIYAMEPADGWAVVNHPWQPHMQHLHVLAAPFLVFVGGWFWKHHVVRRYRECEPRGRGTGLALASLLVTMALSGSLIQVSVSPAWRSVWIWVHVITSGLWLLMVVVHRTGVSGDSLESGSPGPSAMVTNEPQGPIEGPRASFRPDEATSRGGPKPSGGGSHRGGEGGGKRSALRLSGGAPLRQRDRG